MGVPPEHPVARGPELLHYRPWRGTFRGPLPAAWAIARTALGVMFRRKLFWGLYAFCVVIFAFYFFGQYLQVFMQTQFAGQPIRIGTGGLRVSVPPEDLLRILQRQLKLNGSAATFGNFIWFEGYMVMIVLALAGSVIVGNDFQHRSLPFYLSKPISRWHYVLGKCLAVGVFVNLMTTVPAVLLFVQYGLLEDWNYFIDSAHLLLGILGYGLVLTVTLSLLLVATASWLRRTVPLVMVWTAIFFLCRILARWLVDGLKFHESWRLIDLWNTLYLAGQACLGVDHGTIRPRPQPEYWEAALALGVVCALCLIYLHRRIRAVEVVA